MRRTGSKSGGAQRRRSSGSLKFGLLSLHETKVLPTENTCTNFSFDTGSTNASMNKAQGQPPINAPATVPYAQPRRDMPVAHDPIPMPSSHIHRTTSELNILLGEKQATKREEAMFQRIVGGMVNYQSDSHVTVSVKGTAKKHTVEVSATSIPHPTSSANQYSLAQASRDASRSLLSSITTGTEKETKVAPSSSQSSTAHDDTPPSCRTEREFFVGSFRDYAKLTPPNLLKLQEAALGIDRPGHADTHQQRHSDRDSDRNSEVVDAIGDCSDDDELFTLDL